MSFNDHAAKILGRTPEFKFQAMMFGRDAVYLEGAKPIKLESDEMVFKANGSLLTVTGENMSVKEMIGDCVSIIGVIRSVGVGEL